MYPDQVTSYISDDPDLAALHGFMKVIAKSEYVTATDVQYAGRYPNHDQLTELAQLGGATTEGFYDIISKEDEKRLFIRTEDARPYACATFIVGHAQTGNSPAEQ
jgi:hypothetical protein